MKTKNIKVQYSSRISYGNYMNSTRYTAYPKIQMEGKWLEALGFHVGDRLQVEYEEGSIRISIAPEPAMMVAEPPADYGSSKKKGAGL
ncbi:MAG: hypothetical protein BACD_00132 [Bacteroides rodentium]